MVITKAQLTEQLSKFISFRSLSGDFKENKKMLDYAQTLVNKNAFVKRVRNNNAEILLIGNNSKKLVTPDVGYLAHSDVVAAKEDMWQMKVDGNIATGRGVIDMKYSIPVGIALLNKLINENPKNTSFTVAITTDEESGGFDGAKHLAEKLKFRPKILIVPDGGANFIFINKSKGVQRIKLTKFGIATHASTPWKGNNAIVPLCKIVTEIMSRYQKNNQAENWGVTCNVGKIWGGISVNQVCPEASVEFDFRFPESIEGKSLIDEVKSIVNKIDGDENGKSDIKIEDTFSGEPTYTDASEPVVKKFIKTMRKTIGRNIQVKGTNGASDARYFAPYNIPTLMMAPVSGGLHEDNEWLDLDSAVLFTTGLWQFLSEL